jgi:excisionase family DNA binding protein
MTATLSTGPKETRKDTYLICAGLEEDLGRRQVRRKEDYSTAINHYAAVVRQPENVVVFTPAPTRLPSSHEQLSKDTSEERMLLRSSELAELLAISERHLHALTQSGILPCVHVGRLVRYRPDAVREWLRKSESTVKPDWDSLGIRRQMSSPKKTTRLVAPRRKIIAKKAVFIAKAPDQRTSSKTSVVSPQDHRKSDDANQDQSRSARSFFAAQLGIAEEALPRLTNGELMRIAEVDKPTMHGWLYLNRDLPESAIAKLHDYFAAHLEAQR